MRAIDDFLIDRVFQKIADLMAPWISCYGIAGFLFTALVPGGACFIMTDYTSVAHCALGLGGAWTGACGVYNSGKEDERAVTNVMSVERIKYPFIRTAALMILPLTLTGVIAPEIGGNLARVSSASWICWVLALYFMACRKNPPARKTVWAPTNILPGESL